MRQKFRGKLHQAELVVVGVGVSVDASVGDGVYASVGDGVYVDVDVNVEVGVNVGVGVGPIKALNEGPNSEADREKTVLIKAWIGLERELFWSEAEIQNSAKQFKTFCVGIDENQDFLKKYLWKRTLQRVFK